MEKQWGDDWDDVPYEHNAEPPYDNYYEDGIEHKISIKELYFERENLAYSRKC